MNLLTKLIATISLVAIILFVSFKYNRTIIFDYSDSTDLSSKEYSQTNQINSPNTLIESTNSTLNIPDTVVETDTLSATRTNLKEKSLQTNTKTSSSESPTSQVTSSSTSTDLIRYSNDTITTIENNLPESSETIYSEIITFEKAVRKYISKGYRISTLNTLNVKNAGLIDDNLAKRYDVTFKLAEGGYDIIITLKYQVPEEIKKELLNSKGITLNGEMILYTFWIKAYR